MQSEWSEVNAGFMVFGFSLNEVEKVRGFKDVLDWLDCMRPKRTLAGNMVMRWQCTSSGLYYRRNEPDVDMHLLGLFAEIRCRGLAMTVCLCIKDVLLLLILFSFVISVWVWHSKSSAFLHWCSVCSSFFKKAVWKATWASSPSCLLLYLKNTSNVHNNYGWFPKKTKVCSSCRDLRDWRKTKIHCRLSHGFGCSKEPMELYMWALEELWLWDIFEKSEAKVAWALRELLRFTALSARCCRGRWV